MIRKNIPVAGKVSHLILPGLSHEVSRLTQETHTDHYLLSFLTWKAQG